MYRGDTYSSTAGEGRKYFIAALCVIGFLGLIGAVFGGFLGWAATRWAARAGHYQGGAAHLFVPGKFSRRYAISAVLDVPRSPDARHSTPSLQLEIFASGARRVGYTAGFQRRTQDNDRLSGFVYYRVEGHRTKENDLAPLPDGPHRATINVDGNRVTFSIDGRPAYELRDATLANGSVHYFSAGTYVNLAGEHALGTISGITMQSGDDEHMRSIPSPCVVTSYGLSLVRVADAWELSGINHPSQGPVIRAGCADWKRRSG